MHGVEVRVKDYQQEHLLSFRQPKPLLVKIRGGCFVYAGKWEISEEFLVTDDESSAGVPQNHED